LSRFNFCSGELTEAFGICGEWSAVIADGGAVFRAIANVLMPIMTSTGSEFWKKKSGLMPHSGLQ
jgi:hypothetical protein